jgi:hypothetical protein
MQNKPITPAKTDSDNDKIDEDMKILITDHVLIKDIADGKILANKRG